MAQSPQAPKLPPTLVPKPAVPSRPATDDPSVAALLDEIDQEVKAKQFKTFFKRYGSTIATTLIAVIVGTAVASAWTGWQNQQREEDSEKLITLLDNEPEALSDDQYKETLKGYAELGDKAAGSGQRIFARFAEVGLLMRKGETDAAISQLQAVQKDGAFRPLYRDYALLLEVRARMDKEEPQKLLDLMRPLLDPKNAWYLSALESSAILYAKLGKKDEAVSQLQGIVDTVDAPLAAKERANQLMRLYAIK